MQRSRGSVSEKSPRNWEASKERSPWLLDNPNDPGLRRRCHLREGLPACTEARTVGLLVLQAIARARPSADSRLPLPPAHGWLSGAGSMIGDDVRG